MEFKKIINNYLIIIGIPVSIVILYYAFMYSGLFLILNSLSNILSVLILKKRDMPFTVFDSILVDYCTTAIFFILILSFCIFKYRKSKKLFLGFLLSISMMTIILVKYLLLLL